MTKRHSQFLSAPVGASIRNRHSLTRLGGLAAMLMLSTFAAHATVVVYTTFDGGTTISNPSSSFGINGTGAGWSIKFTPTSNVQVNQASFGVNDPGPSTFLCSFLDPDCDGNLQVELFADSGNTPGTLLASGTGSVPLDSLTNQVFTATFGPVSLTSGSVYWIGLFGADSHTVVDWVANSASSQNSNVANSSGQVLSSWGAGFNPYVQVASNISGAPEPGSFLLLAAGIGGLAFRKLRAAR